MPTAWSIAALDALRATSTSPPAPSSSWLAGFMMPAFTSTWVNFVACMVFQAVVCVMCVHEGPTSVHRVANVSPNFLGRWLRKGDGLGSRGGSALAANAEVGPPLSVAQSWKLGALHERFIHTREESSLREAGEVLQRLRPLTEKEFLSLERISARATRRPRGCCNLADCMLSSGMIGGICAIWWALHDFANSIQVMLDEAMNLVGVVPDSLLCLVALACCLAIVCEGLRAADSKIGGCIALAGVGGATGTWFCSNVLQWATDPSYSAYYSWFVNQKEPQVILVLLFALPLLASIALKLDFALGGFLAMVCAFFSVVLATSEVLDTTGIGGDNSGVIPVVLASLTVDVLFSLAAFLRVQTRHLKLFASGVMATGVFTLHLALFFNSFSESDDMWHRVFLQLPVCACLITGWGLGRALGSEGLKNNSLFFGGLYIAATIISVWERLQDGNSSIFVGLLSLGSRRFGVYLRHHDGFVASLWTLDAELVREKACCLENRTVSESPLLQR